MTSRDYTTADMRALVQCKKCAAILDARNKVRHSQWHAAIDNIAVTLFGGSSNADSTVADHPTLPY